MPSLLQSISTNVRLLILQPYFIKILKFKDFDVRATLLLCADSNIDSSNEPSCTLTTSLRWGVGPGTKSYACKPKVRPICS